MPRAITIGRTLRYAGRTREILTVLVRYGFEDVVTELGLERLVERGRKLLGRTGAEARLEQLPQAVRLRKAMEELGPTFVKLGQVLSTRPDLVPPEWAEEFGKLQDDVPPADPEEIRQRLREEFGDRRDVLFRELDDEPLAAGSIAQVHGAVLADGTPVVVKILRPGIREVIRSDMAILSALAEFVEDHFQDLGYSPTRVVKQFERELDREIDLSHEARSTDRLRALFAEDPGVHFPRVYPDASTPHVLTLERVEGTLLSQLENGTFSAARRRRIVAHGTRAVFRMCLEIGFFHADPHPGNIFALEDGSVCFIDCGMIGYIDPGSKQLLADLVQGVVGTDLDRVIQATLTLADADPSLAHDRRFRADTWEFVSRFEDVTLERLDMAALLDDFFTRIRAHNLQCPADIVFLIKAITTIQGVGERLCPDFDLIGHVRPFIEKLVGERYGFRAVRKRLLDALAGYSELFETLPGQFRALFYDLRRDRLTINLEHQGLHRMTHALEHASHNISRALIIASLMVGSSILLLADHLRDGWILALLGGLGFGLAAIWTVILLVAERLWRR